MLVPPVEAMQCAPIVHKVAGCYQEMEERILIVAFATPNRLVLIWSLPFPKP